jgi:predicted glycoside hydrolase/deacetylase ChbG (UPF0249 family)
MTTTSTVRIIVNADDLAASDDVNAAIFDGMSDGVITSSTIMATGSALTAAARGTARFPGASFGVHLNLTDHRPLTSSPALASLVGANGEFRRGAVYEAKWTKQLVDAVVDEWTEQVQRVRAAGVAVSHLDSHHHVHTIPGLFVALKRVQRNTGIRRVRGTWTIYDRAHSPSAKLRWSKRAWWWALRHVYPTRTTGEFSDFLMFRRAVLEGSYRPATWPSFVELMVHPNGNPAESGEEAAALRSGWIASLPVRAELVSYAEV